MSQSTDIAALISRCKRYDREAQKQLYLRFADLLMNTAIRYANDRASAEDLVHDTFIKVFKNIAQYKQQGNSFEGWIKRILINEALQGFRKTKKFGSIDEEALLAIPSDELSAIDTLQAEDVLELLKKIPEGRRIIFNLNVMEGYKHEEIGQMLKISANASRAQLSRAKKELRVLLQNINPCTLK